MTTYRVSHNHLAAVLQTLREGRGWNGARGTGQDGAAICQGIQLLKHILFDAEILRNTLLVDKNKWKNKKMKMQNLN